MTRPLVSVVIPSHNYGRYLTEAIDSALAQDYSSLEIIVVDDGSTDNTRAVVDAYRGDGVRYVFQEQSGPGAARNVGARMARGELVAFLDADDAWLPGKITKQAAHFDAHPELGLVATGGFDCDPENRPTGIREVPRIASGMVFEKLLVRNFIMLPSVMVSKRCLEAVGGFSDRRFGEDWDLWLRIAQRYPIGFVPEPLMKRRGHTDSLSFETAAGLASRYEEISDRYVDQANPPWMRPVLRRRLRSTARFYAAGYVIDHSRRRAAQLLVGSLWLDPVSSFSAKATLLLRSILPDPMFNRLRKTVRRNDALPRRR